jgi:predicted nuclease with TOPRIM domain
MKRLYIFLFLLLTNTTLLAQAHPDISFDRSFVELQRKLDDLKAHGDKLNEKSRKELDDLLVQMNHQHAELKRELDKKNQELNEKLTASQHKGEVLLNRLSDAWSELSSGAGRAWNKLSNGE